MIILQLRLRAVSSTNLRKLFEQPELLEAARLTGCKNHSRIERLGDHELFALDWGVALRTEKKIGSDITHVAIRGHSPLPETKYSFLFCDPFPRCV